MQPRVLLMDGPASALDPIATYRIEELMVELKREYTLAVVTHNMQQASRVSDHTGFFLAGSPPSGQWLPGLAIVPPSPGCWTERKGPAVGAA